MLEKTINKCLAGPCNTMCLSNIIEDKTKITAAKKDNEFSIAVNINGKQSLIMMQH